MGQDSKTTRKLGSEGGNYDDVSVSKHLYLKTIWKHGNVCVWVCVRGGF